MMFSEKTAKLIFAGTNLFQFLKKLRGAEAADPGIVWRTRGARKKPNHQSGDRNENEPATTAASRRLPQADQVNPPERA